MTSIDPKIQDFGNTELNEFYNNLDEPTKEKINKIKNQDVKINLLKDMSNPELNDLFNSLPKEKQNEYEETGLRDKYMLLKELKKTRNPRLKPQVKPYEELEPLNVFEERVVTPPSWSNLIPKSPENSHPSSSKTIKEDSPPQQQLLK